MSAATKGFLLACLTVLMWGFLPMAAQPLLQVMSPQTLVTTRFIFAALILWPFLAARQQLPSSDLLLHPRRLILLTIAIIGLFGNFFLFSKVLLYLSPAAAQILAQVQPFMLMFASVFLFKERLNTQQIIAAVLLFIGILAFFNRELPQLFNPNMQQQLLGIVLSLIASAVWVAYSLVQKQLNLLLNSMQTLALIYLGCAALGLPFMDWTIFAQLNLNQWLLLIFCCANTPIAYGAFAESIRLWELNKVSALLTLIPLITIIAMECLHLAMPQRFAAPSLNLLAYLGAILVISGALCAVSAKTKR